MGVLFLALYGFLWVERAFGGGEWVDMRSPGGVGCAGEPPPGWSTLPAEALLLRACKRRKSLG